MDATSSPQTSSGSILESLSDEIDKREEANKKLSLSGKILYPFGYSGAGKTTFILYCNGTSLKLVPETGKIVAAEELPEELKHLEVGAQLKSCTVYVSGTSVNGLLFLDGPGFMDTGGFAIDVANSVALSSILKQIKALTPVLFLDYPGLQTQRGASVRTLIRGFAAMFSDDVTRLVKSTIVVFSKVPDTVSLQTLLAEFKSLSEATDVADNTPEVMEILDNIVWGLQKRQGKPMVDKVLIFRPLDEGYRRIVSVFKSLDSKPLENPSELYQVKLPPQVQIQLETALTQLKEQVSMWLRSKETDKIVKEMSLLHKLSSSIPAVDSTFRQCVAGLQQSLLDKVFDAKSVLQSLVEVGTSVNQTFLTKFLQTRQLLASVENLRPFMGNFDSIADFDDWTISQFKEFVSQCYELKDFGKISFALTKMRDLHKHFEYLNTTPNVSDLNKRLLEWVQTKVKRLQEDIASELNQLSSENIDQLVLLLRSFSDAVEQVGEYVSLDSKAVQSSVANVTSHLDRIEQAVSEYLDTNPGSPIRQEVLIQFNTIKAVTEHKALSSILNQSTSSRSRYNILKDKCKKIAENAFEQLTMISKTPQALAGNTEKVIRIAKGMGEFDKDLKNYTDLELARAMIAIDGNVDGIIENLKNNVLYKPDGPDYGKVPDLLKQLDSCRWLDNYSNGGNRIEVKKKEATEYLESSLKSLVKRIQNSFSRNKLDDVVKYFTMLDSLNFLDNCISGYQDCVSAATDYLQEQITKVLTQGEARLKVSRAQLGQLQDKVEHPSQQPQQLQEVSGFTLSETDTLLGSLSNLLPVGDLLGMKEKISELQRGLNQFLANYSGNIINFVITDQKYKFDSYRLFLDELLMVNNKNEYPNLPETVRVYDKVMNQCVTKIQSLAAKVKSNLTDDEFGDIPAMLETLESASVLMFHIPICSQIISEAQAARATVTKEKINDIKEAFNLADYLHCKVLLESLPSGSKMRTDSLRFVTNSLINKVSALRTSISFFSISDQPQWTSLLKDKLEFQDKCYNAFAELVKPDDFFKTRTDEIFRAFDSKFESELFHMENQQFSDDSQLQAISSRVDMIEKYITQLGASQDQLAMSRKRLATIKSTLRNAFHDAENQIRDLENNISTVDQFCTTLLAQKHSKYSHYLYQTKNKITEYKRDTIQAKTTDEIEKGLTRLKNLYNGFENPDLRKHAQQMLTEANEHMAKTKREQDLQLDSILLDLTIDELTIYFQECQHDTLLTQSAQRKVSTAASKLIIDLHVSSSLEEIGEYDRSLSKFQALSNAFPSFVKPAQLEGQKQVLRNVYSDSITKLQPHYQTSSGLYPDEVPVLSVNIKKILVFKSIDEKMNFKVIAEEEFARALLPFCEKLSSNRQQFDSAVAQGDFLKLNETLKLMETVDPLVSSLKSFIQETRLEGIGPLATILSTCLNFAEAQTKIRTWLHTTSDRVDEMWTKQEFTLLARTMGGIESKSYRHLSKWFQEIEKWLTQAYVKVEKQYSMHAETTSQHLKNENWKQFCDGFELLGKLTPLETLLKRNDFSQILAKVQQKIEQMAKVDVNDLKELQKALCDLNKFSQEVPQFKDRIVVVSNSLLQQLASQPKGGDRVYDLGKSLEQDGGPMANNARDVLASFRIFSAVNQEIWKTKTKGQDINWALGEDHEGKPRFTYSNTFTQPSAAMWTLEQCWKFCKEAVGKDQNSKWLKMYSKFEEEFKQLYDQKLEITVSNTKDYFPHRIKDKDNFVSALAGICVTWSKTKSGATTTNQNTTMRLQPHPIQVLCLFRLLELSPKGTFYSQLIEVLTGEGKSVVLGVVSTFFALLNKEVYCVCYSEYLSRRDYSDFSDVFEAFEVTELISYSTISEMCENILNAEGNVRELTKLVIECASKGQKPQKQPRQRDRVLLIDEVDTFFGSDFYGNTYNPATLISNDDSYEMLKFIFANKSNVNFGSVSKTVYYLNITKTFPKLKPMIDHQVQKMLLDVKDFENTPEKPVVTNGLIYYKEQDSMSCKKAFGYKTAFQYFNFQIKGVIRDESVVKSHVGIYIGCGNFSFAEIPLFDFLVRMGLSGTLRSLTTKEKEIIQKYGIERLAFAPSIYGGSKLNEKSEVPFVSPIMLRRTKDDWFLRIAQNASEKIKSSRAVLIFFENLEELNEFKASPHCVNLSDVQVLEENEPFKDNIIKKATSSKTTTLCTRPFGRGVDFICRDPATLGPGGVHVIQTFVAQSEAEQIQIKGRAARQGDPGSHEFILLHEKLVRYLGPKEGQPATSGFKDFDHDSCMSLKELTQKISTLRDSLYVAGVSELDARRADALVGHSLTLDFHNELKRYDGSEASHNKITDMLMKINQAAISEATSNYHLFFCLDESGSMSDDWPELIKAVEAFITKRIEMCKANGAQISDLVTVVNYGSTGRVVFKNQNVSANLASKIDYRGGGTDFSAGLQVVEQCIKTAGTPSLVPCLLFMSDGGSSNGEAEMTRLHSNYPDLKVFVVGFGSGCDRTKLTKMAQLGGGQFFFGADGSQLKVEFEAISVKISGGVMAL